MKLIKIKQLFIFIIIISIIFLVSIEFHESHPLDLPHKPVVLDGKIDVSQWDFSKGELLPLNGLWELYWMKLLEPQDFEKNENEKTFVPIPNDLTKVIINDAPLSSDGYATLRIHIKVPDIDKIYGLKFKYFASANKIWVNGEQVSSSGNIGTHRESYKPQYLPLEALFKSDTEEIEVIVQIANFHHRRIRLNTVLFGTSDQILKHTYNGIIHESVIFGSLMLISLYYCILYFIQKRDPALIYLSIISFVVAIRSGIVSERILIRSIPDLPAEIMSKIGYLPAFILLPLFLLYVKEIFKSSQLDKAVKISKYAGILLIIIILITTVKVYDWIFQYGQWINVLGALYILYLLISNGLIKQVRGTSTMVIGGLILLLAATNDIFRELDLINTPELLSTAVVFFILLQAAFLAWRFNDVFESTQRLAEENEAMYEEIQDLNKDLEDKIKIRTKALEIANKRLDVLSKMDPLTGLHNRRYFDEQFRLEWSRSLREKQPLSIIIIDIDFFKQYNDTYGHVEGDECLRKIANTLKSNLKRKNDILVRYGGEEFVLLLPNTDSYGALILSEMIRKAVKELKIPHTSSLVSDYVTISLGTNTLVVSKHDSKKDFIDSADKALYCAKETGRDRVETGYSA